LPLVSANSYGSSSEISERIGATAGITLGSSLISGLVYYYYRKEQLLLIKDNKLAVTELTTKKLKIGIISSYLISALFTFFFFLGEYVSESIRQTYAFAFLIIMSVS